MSEFHDDSTHATEPGCITVSLAKLRRLHPELFGTWARLKAVFSGRSSEAPVRMLCEHMRLGDARAAVVVRVEPLVVAAYTDELDCAVLIEFDSSFARDYELRVGSRLLTVNTYGSGTLAHDLVKGPAAFDRWANFQPCIAEFMSDDGEYIEIRKRDIAEGEWTRARTCGDECLARGATPRDGRPLRSFFPR
jgi:hypothetical protein